jgi:hypothetical protein
LSYRYAEEALNFAVDDRAKALALDIMAISASELHLPATTVVRLLIEAVRLAPRSARIQSNLNAVVASLEKGSTPSQWSIPENQVGFAPRKFTVTASTSEPDSVAVEHD